MARGDAVVGISSIDPDATLDIRPSSGEEWIIHNVYYNVNIELKIATATQSLVFASLTAPDVYSKDIHVTYNQWLKVKNTDATSGLVAYDGMVTKSG